MVDIYLEYNQDLVITANGSIAIAQGWDEVRERIIRNFLTNSAVPLPDGSTTPPDYVFSPLYGLSAGALIDQNPTEQWIADFTRRMRQACLSDVAVDPGSVPSILVTRPAIGTVQIYVGVTLVTGQQGGISISFVPASNAATKTGSTAGYTPPPITPPPLVEQQVLTLTPSGPESFMLGAAPLPFTCVSSVATDLFNLVLLINGAQQPLPSAASLTSNGLQLSFAYAPTVAGSTGLQVLDLVNGGDSNISYITAVALTTATALSLYTPPWAVAGVSINVLTGTYSGGPPLSMDYSINSGASWTTEPAANLSTASGTFQLVIGTQAAGNYAAGSAQVRDTNAPAVTAQTVGLWVVSTFNPATPSSGTLVFASQIANPALIGLDATGAPQNILDWNGSNQYLQYGPQTPNNGLGGSFAGATLPVWSRAGGNDGGQTVIKMVQATAANEGSYTAVNNFYQSGPVGGPNDALIGMCNTTAADIGNWWFVQAFQYSPNTTDFGATGIWTNYNGDTGNAQLTQYISAGRDHSHSFTAQWFGGVTEGGELFAAPAVVPTVNVWYVLGVLHTGATYKYYLRVNTTVPSFNSVTITGTGSTVAFTGQYFSIGGGSPADASNRLTGNSFQAIGDFFTGTGTPSTADLAGYMTLAGASAGLQLSSSP